MKKIYRFVAAAALMPLALSCQSIFPGRTGRIIVSISSPEVFSTRANSLDVGDFILTVTDSRGKNVWEGPFAQSPDELITSAGTYTVSAVSCLFDEPAFDKPQYGDSQVVTVSAGGTVAVRLQCSQMNSGVRLVVDDSFEETFPDGVLYLKGAGGRLMYDYDETRTAFYKPGSVSVTLHDNGDERTLSTRNISAREMLVLKLSSNAGPVSGGVSIEVDTARTWSGDSYVYGGGATGGSGPSDALGVDEARSAEPMTDVWVCGYVVGVAVGTARFSFDTPFTKNTNLVIGGRAVTTDPEHCMTVELKSGAMRDALNLVDHPENKGRKLYLRGDTVPSYYGVPGIKNVSEYEFR